MDAIAASDYTGAVMHAILLVVVILLLFGGGGFCFGGPAIGGAVAGALLGGIIGNNRGRGNTGSGAAIGSDRQQSRRPRRTAISR